MKALTGFFAKLSKEEKIVLYIASAVVIIAIMDNIFLRPAQDKMKQLKSEIEAKTIDIEKNLTILGYKDRILREYQSINGYLTDSSLSDEELIAILLKEIESNASSNNIKLININPVTARKGTLYSFYNLTIDCEGKMEDIVRFMYEIENSEKLIKVNSYTIAPKNRREYSSKCTFAIEMLVISPEETDEVI